MGCKPWEVRSGAEELSKHLENTLELNISSLASYGEFKVRIGKHEAYGMRTLNRAKKVWRGRHWLAWGVLRQRGSHAKSKGEISSPKRNGTPAGRAGRLGQGCDRGTQPSCFHGNLLCIPPSLLTLPAFVPLICPTLRGVSLFYLSSFGLSLSICFLLHCLIPVVCFSVLSSPRGLSVSVSPLSLFIYLLLVCVCQCIFFKTVFVYRIPIVCFFVYLLPVTCLPICPPLGCLSIFSSSVSLYLSSLKLSICLSYSRCLFLCLSSPRDLSLH